MALPGSTEAAPPVRMGFTLRSLYLLGPAFVAGVAYLDPGNVATNLTAGSKYGYLLVWVIVMANLSAWVVQYLSAKFGIVTGNSLPEYLGNTISRRYVRYAYWAQAQIVAIATDVAEIIGGAIALKLLFGTHLVVGAILTAVFSIAHLSLRERGRHRLFEIVILLLIAITAVGFTAGVFVEPIDRGALLQGLIPSFNGQESLLLGVGIFGATIMPHAIYAHSALSRDRFASSMQGRTIREVLVATRWDVSLAMLVAGFVNLGIFLVGAIHLFGKDVESSIEGAHSAINASLGVGFGLMFAVGLLASGIASSSVGTYASTIINQGLMRFSTSLILQRIFAVIPAIMLISVSNNPTMSLVISQVVLSFGIPFALFPLVILTSKKSLMGDHTNGFVMRTLSGAIASFLTVLNVVLIALVFFGS